MLSALVGCHVNGIFVAPNMKPHVENCLWYNLVEVYSNE